MPRRLLGLALAPLLVGAAPQAPPPVFRAEAEYVEVDAFVTDEKGEFVSGLTRDDFQVFEEGAPEKIAVFAEISVPVDRGPETPRALPPPDVATNQEALRGRVYAIVLDDLHTDAQRSGAVRKLAREFVEGHLARNDVAAVVSTGGRADSTLGFTGQKERLLETIDRFAGRKTRSATLERLDTIERQRDLLRSESRPRDAQAPTEGEIAPRPGLERDPYDLQRVNDARASLEILEGTARAFGGLEGRRKAIVWFGEGIDYDTLDVTGRAQRDGSAILASTREALAAATRHGVAVYTVDPRGPLAPGGPDDIRSSAPAQGADFGIDSQSLAREARLSQENLRTLAEQTGGLAAVDTNDFADAFDRIVRASSRYYLLGYYPSDSRRDGAYRRLDVRAARRGLHVVAREGYVRPGPGTEKDRAPRIGAADGTSPELRRLLESPWPQPGLPLAVTAAAFKGTAREAPVAVTIQLSGREGPLPEATERAAIETEVSYVVIDRDGQVRAGERLLARPRSPAPPRERRTGMGFVRMVRLPPGRYQLRVAAREGGEGPLGSVSHDFEVPDYRERKLAMSSLVVASRQAALSVAPAIDDAAKARLAAAPTAMRRFVPTDVLTASAEVYDSLEPTHEVGVTTRVTTADGREVFLDTRLRGAAPLESAEPGFRTAIDIPLADLRPGRYLLQVAATATLGDVASREVAFEVVPGSGAGPVDPLPAVAPPAARRADGRPLATRIDRLEAWLDAVERHEPGTLDASALLVRHWSPGALLDLAADVAVVDGLIRDPGRPVMWVVDPTRPGRPQRAPYTADDERRIRGLAAEAASRCADAPCARTRLLKRGAVLHTDALVRADADAPGPERNPRDEERYRIRFDDGRQQGTERTSGHMELAHALLENVPDPGRDDTVRLWFTAVAAFGQYHERHTRQEDRGVQLFPQDADLLLFAGTLHEGFASPRMQSLARAARLPGGVSHGIADERSELREAEKALRRAVAARPSFVEARIRLGRVLYRLGRSEAAVRELEDAVSRLSSGEGADEPDAGLLLYYAEMFLGAAREALGRLEPARASYARAAALYPRAPSPRLAQSQLALRGQDRAKALAAVKVALEPAAGGSVSDDPWWRYHVIQGRGADGWLDRFYRSATAAP
jgi:VWFA-related protein